MVPITAVGVNAKYMYMDTTRIMIRLIYCEAVLTFVSERGT